MARWVIALAFLLPLGWQTLHKQRKLIFEHLRLIVLLGIFGITLFQTLMYEALQTTTAVNAVLLLSTCPVFIVIGNTLYYREALGLLTVCGVCLSLCGAIVLISHGDIATLLQLNFYTGDLLMLIACLTWAIYSIALNKKPAGLSQLSLLLSTTIVGVIVLIIWSLFSDRQHPISSWSTDVFGALVFLGVFSSVVAFLCWNRGVELIGSNNAGVFLHLIPLFTALLSYALLGEGLSVYHLVGAVLIFSGIAVFSKLGNRQNTDKKNAR